MANDFLTMERQMKLEQAIEIVSSVQKSCGDDLVKILLQKAITRIREAQQCENLNALPADKTDTK